MSHHADWKAACTAPRPEGAPSTATRRLTPRTKPICLAIVTTAEPVAARAGGRSAVAAEMIVGRAKPTPTPPTSHPGRTSTAYDGAVPTELASSAVPTPNSRQPSAASTPAGTRDASRWATAAKTGTIRGPGAIASPVRRAEYPHTSCNHRTMASSPPANATENMTAVMLLQANALTRSRAGSTTGSGCREDRRQNTAKDAAATAKAARSAGDDQPQSGPSTSARARAPMPTAIAADPPRSGTRLTARSRESGTTRRATTSAAIPTGTLTMKTQRQDACTSRPPTTGPKAAASAPVAAQMRTARTLPASGVEASSRPNDVGVSAAAPTACRPRKRTSVQRSWLAAQAALAAVNSASPARNPGSRPYRSASRPRGTSRAAYRTA